jgi:hypothetical protein
VGSDRARAAHGASAADSKTVRRVL